jgi:hypothetical protein
MLLCDHLKRRGLYFFLLESKRTPSNGNRIFYVPQKIVSDRISYIDLRGCWFNIFVLNVHTPSKEKIGDKKLIL